MTYPSGHAPAEEDAIRRLSAWLARQFPELPVEDVERAVYGKYHSFGDSPVRDFVPVLVEQATRRQLAAHSGPDATAAEHPGAPHSTPLELPVPRKYHQQRIRSDAALPASRLSQQGLDAGPTAVATPGLMHSLPHAAAAITASGLSHPHSGPPNPSHLRAEPP